MRFEDPLAVFQPTTDDEERRKKERELALTDPGLTTWTRADLFSPVGYRMEKHLENHEDSVVKVPYSWDFGFLMFHDQAWQTATQLGGSTEEAKSVQVLLKMMRMQLEAGDPEKAQKTKHSETKIGWRDFFEACVFVAKTNGPSFARSDDKPFRAFNIAPRHDESLSCLVLEIWASEINKPSLFAKFRHESVEKYEGLADLLTGHRQQLFRTWLLLTQVFPRTDFSAGKTFASDEAHAGAAVAERHWYASAAAGLPPSNSLNGYRPAGLPGSYSTRGDWFIGVARGSRSYKMGELAIDLLTTRRGNVVRLQEGIGLPVRECDKTVASELWTPIPRVATDEDEPTGSRARTVSYEDLRRLGAWDDSDEKGRDEFRWLWRSRIKHYERDARLWRRWLCSLLLERLTKMDELNGFVLYDLAKAKHTNNRESGSDEKGTDFKDMEEWFEKRCDEFELTLKRAARRGAASSGV